MFNKCSRKAFVLISWLAEKRGIEPLSPQIRKLASLGLNFTELSWGGDSYQYLREGTTPDFFTNKFHIYFHNSLFYMFINHFQYCVENNAEHYPKGPMKYKS